MFSCSSFYACHSYAEALKDQGQVFLPINNALSPVGHVHWYLEQLGQGIQHVASRVQSLPDYVQRANDYREITGEGFTFLNIPRTYYGLLDQSSFKTGGEAGEFLDHSPPKKNKRERERERNDAKAASSPTTGGDSFDEVQSAVSANQEAQLTATGALSDAEAHATRLALQDAGIVDDTGAVSLSVTDEAVMEAIEDVDLGKSISALAARKKKRVVCKCVKRSIYGNLWKLLKDQVRMSQSLETQYPYSSYCRFLICSCLFLAASLPAFLTLHAVSFRSDIRRNVHDDR